MELSLSGSGFKTFARSITCLARIGTELILQASSSKLELRTLNSSRSAYQMVTFCSDFFDVFTVQPSSSIQCSVLLKSLLALLRTSPAVVDRLAFSLASPDASKLESTLHCLNGMKKTYWVTCNEEPEIQQLSLDKQRFPSSLTVRPRDLTRLLANFQSTLQEITLIATDPAVLPSQAAEEIGGKAVELRSYIDPTKDSSDMTLLTQLWIDPGEEFLLYTHVGDPVDITFSVKELKAFLTFCEGCEVDINLYFEKAGEPILMAPRFGFDDGTSSDFDAALVLATMLVSQLASGNTSQPQPATVPQSEQARAANASGVSEHPSDHTKIWSDLSGSAAKSLDGSRTRQVNVEENPIAGLPNDLERDNMINVPAEAIERHPMDIDGRHEVQDMAEANGVANTQHHPSNWVGAGDDDDDDEEEELYVQSTPQFYD